MLRSARRDGVSCGWVYSSCSSLCNSNEGDKRHYHEEFVNERLYTDCHHPAKANVKCSVKNYGKDISEKVQVGKDQEMAQSAKDSHSKNPRWEKNQTNNQVPIP